MNRINIIGDIHGRTGWQELVDDDAINVFVGDYFDPYENISYSDLEENFMNILSYAIYHTSTILLIGNHDDHYLHQENGTASRFNKSRSAQIREMLSEIKPQIAYYNDEHKLFITHAGVSKAWYNMHFGKLDTDPKIIEENINNLYRTNPYRFSFECNQHDYFECYGDEPSHSPIWIRPQSLVLNNIFKGTDIKQIVGHSQFRDILHHEDGVIFVDCLGTKTKSLTL